MRNIMELDKCCDWCEESIVLREDGCIVLTEIPPLFEGIEMERFQFCGYKCLQRWLDL